jgi:hypothetical protein
MPNGASPQTDEACRGRGSNHHLHGGVWWNRLRLGPVNGLNLRGAKPARSEPAEIAHRVAEILKREADGEGIDRMYCNVYVPSLQYEHSRFFRYRRGQRLPSAALILSDNPKLCCGARGLCGPAWYWFERQAVHMLQPPVWIAPLGHPRRTDLQARLFSEHVETWPDAEGQPDGLEDAAAGAAPRHLRLQSHQPIPRAVRSSVNFTIPTNPSRLSCADDPPRVGKRS